MKRLIAFLLSALLIFSCVGCSNSMETETTTIIETTTEVEETTSNIDEFDKNIVLNTNDFIFVIKNAEKNETTNTWNVKIYVENKTNKVITFSWKDVLINKIKVNTDWSYDLTPYGKEYIDVTFKMEDLAKDKIEIVKNLKFILSVLDEKKNILEDTEYVFSLTVTKEEETTTIETTTVKK